MNIRNIENVFNGYLQDYDMNNKNINFKYHHSYRVERLSNQLSKGLNDSHSSADLAMTIGLLHDIGRFRQLEMFNSYSDDNIDHGDLGVKILFDEGLIKKFDIDKRYYDIIYFAIKNHNKYMIEPCPYNDYVHQARIIRDVDKIDILDTYVNGNNPIVKGNSLISEDAEREFYQKGSISKNSRHTLSDAELLRIALILDINFRESFTIIENKDIIENYYKLLNYDERFMPYLDYVSDYVKKRSKKLC